VPRLPETRMGRGMVGSAVATRQYKFVLAEAAGRRLQAAGCRLEARKNFEVDTVPRARFRVTNKRDTG
jgi:hypothetical protein